MTPEQEAEYDRVYDEYKKARASGELGTAVRLLTRLNKIENGEDADKETEE